MIPVAHGEASQIIPATSAAQARHLGWWWPILLTSTIALCSCDAGVVPHDGSTDGAPHDSAPDGASQDGSTRDADVPGDSSVPSVQVRITRPSSPLYASSGTADIQIFVDGGDPERVDLLLNDEPVATLPPPYRYDLTIDDLGETTHEVVARARVDGVEHVSPPLLIVVDRVPPRVVAQRPSGSEPYVFGTPLEVEFSEPMLATSFTGDSVRVANGAGRRT